MIWYRIDNRLIHGQVIEAWLPYVKASRLIVANDALASDPLRQQILMLAVPSRVRTSFITVDSLSKAIQGGDSQDNILVLFADCEDARKAYDSGVCFECCNIGNLHYAEGKRQISPHVALSGQDESCLRYLESNNVELDFRSIPADVNSQPKHW